MKLRLDKLLVEKKLAESRQQSQAIILAGLVEVNGQRVDKPGALVAVASQLLVKGNPCPFVSRGGLKLAKGLEFFQVSPQGFTCADIGASTGGFTDCLLQRGAAKVYAVDVGYGQLDWKLRQDQRVVVLERTNARLISHHEIPEPLDLAVIDAAFISLQLLLPPLLPLFAREIAIIALIKPQFEVGKGLVGKGGVVTDPELHQQVIEKITTFALGLGLASRGTVASPILGPKGNTEFLTYLTGHQAPG